jgi:hypothetical protein
MGTNGHAMVLIALFAVTFAAMRGTTRRHQRKRNQLGVMPYQMGGWSGFDSRFDAIYGSNQPIQVSCVFISRALSPQSPVRGILRRPCNDTKSSHA